MKKFNFLLVLVVSLVALSCARKETEMTILTENYPPLSYVEDGVVSGYGAEIVAAIQEELNTDVTPQLMDWEKAYQRALNEKNIVLFTMERTPEREELFHFIGPLGENTAFFYARADSEIELQDLAAAREVSSIATTKDWFTEQHLIEQGFTNLVSSVDPVQTLHMVMNEEAELGVFTDITFPELVLSAGYEPTDLVPVLSLMSSHYYIAISRGTDSSIVEKWENAFAALQNDGTVAAIHDKWFPRID